jgi:signal transduction histidine kinase/DNA-binding response OmpR family regulator
VLETVLDDPGYRLVRAHSADQALLALVVDEFALLILDIRMPGMTGFELALLIKERRKTAQVPIIFLTAYYNEDQHVLEGYGTGAVDYLHKPVNPAILRSKVAVFAELYRKNRECTLASRALLTEVTERSRAQQQLRELNATLEQRVTERTEALAESEERYRVLFSALPVAAFVCDRDAKIRYFNARATELWQGDPKAGANEPCGGMKLWLKDSTPVPHARCPMMEVMRTGIPAKNVEMFIERRDGSRLPVIVNVAALKSAQGEVVGAVTAFDDISERRQFELELQAAKSKAEKASLAKSEFLSRMSHELRSPLHTILGFAQLAAAASPLATPSQKEPVEQILKSGHYLLELINEVLDLALIESGKLVVALVPVSVTEVVRECQAMIEPQAQQRAISVTYPSADIQYIASADRTRLKQVLLNLLSNAVKYNKVGGAVVVACTASRPGRVRIGVEDTGKGLTRDDLAQLFQSFNRLGNENGNEEGTGIGLVVSKRLVEAMGGELGVQSTLGKGSVFWFELDLATA